LSRLFCQDQDQGQDFYFKTKTKTKTLGLKTKTKTKTLFFVLEAPRDQDFGHEDYITALLYVFVWNRQGTKRPETNCLGPKRLTCGRIV